MKVFKKTLATIVTALSIACGHGSSQIHYSKAYDPEWLTGIKIQGSDGTHAVGIEAHYGEHDGGFSEKKVAVPIVGDIHIYNKDKIRRLTLLPYVDRELYRWKPCEYFSAGISLGLGYLIEFNLTNTNYKIPRDESELSLDNIPSSIKIPGHFTARLKPELRIWQVPFHYTLIVTDQIDFAHHFSIGYEF